MTDVAARRFRLASPATATACGALVLVLLGVTVTLAVLTHQLTVLNVATGLTIPLAYAAVGVVVARHQPRNPVGWILILFVVLLLIPLNAGYYAVLRYRLGYHGIPLGPAAVAVASLLILAPALFPVVILLFPDGRLTARRWRWVLWGYAGLVCYLGAINLGPALAADAGHRIRVNSSGDVTDTDHLTGWFVHPPGWLTAVVFLSLGVIWLSFVGHQVLSWRRASGEYRQQLKWLACGAAVALGLSLLGNVVSSNVVSRLLEVSLVALPAGIGVGILKYRLYDIDKIISRTLAYALVTGLLAGLYAGLVLLATQVLRLHTPVAVAASTLAAAALFSPLRRRVQRAVDRRFNRARYDADQMVTAFAARLKDTVDLDSVQGDLASVVTKALEPAHVSMWLSGRTPVDAPVGQECS
jgi:ABC-type multidrug transport system fused ATPase/permease subunit